jgi:hypothetical protein
MVVAPLASQAAVIVEHANVRAFSLHSELLRGSDCE